MPAAQVNLTDGRTVQLGCVNTTDGRTGCVPGQLDAGIRAAAFHFAPGERVSSLSLFAGPDNRGTANTRAGAIRFSTSLVRRFNPVPLHNFFCHFWPVAWPGPSRPHHAPLACQHQC